MIICWDRGMFWHSDCEKDKHHSGIMKEIDRREETRSLIKCLSCGKSGYYPKGDVGSLCCEELK
mgnify:CR=1 FL=1